MNLLIDLLPVLAFFGVFRYGRAHPDVASALLQPLVGDLHPPAALAEELPAVLLATLFTVLATLVQVGILLALRRRVRPTVWVGAVLVAVFGGLTLWLQDETFIKWKPTMLYASFAALLGGGKVFFRRNLLGSVLGEDVDLPPLAWDRLLVAWTLFFLAMAALNLFVAYNFPTDTWVDFKLFGATGLTFAFSIISGFVLLRGEAAPGGGKDA